MDFFLGILILLVGVEELRKEKKGTGWLCIIISVFTLFLTIRGLIF
ncbi:DUF3953 domain-containing protein [Halobacillus rhizosphaerae]